MFPDHPLLLISTGFQPGGKDAVRGSRFNGFPHNGPATGTNR